MCQTQHGCQRNLIYLDGIWCRCCLLHCCCFFPGITAVLTVALSHYVFISAESVPHCTGTHFLIWIWLFFINTNCDLTIPDEHRARWVSYSDRCGSRAGEKGAQMTGGQEWWWQQPDQESLLLLSWVEPPAGRRTTRMCRSSLRHTYTHTQFCLVWFRPRAEEEDIIWLNGFCSVSFDMCFTLKGCATLWRAWLPVRLSLLCTARISFHQTDWNTAKHFRNSSLHVFWKNHGCNTAGTWHYMSHDLHRKCWSVRSLDGSTKNSTNT